MASRLHQLSALGQSVWIDFLSRELLESGALARAIDGDAVVGVTSNPTIFADALSGGDAYDEQIAAAGGDDRSVFLELAMRDVAMACDLLRSVWERTEARDGYVSIEVDPNLADDIHSVASFFVSRVDTETDGRLAHINRDDLKGRLGIANAKLAYQQYKELFRGARWEALSAHGATAQRCLWASTSVKDPSLPDTLYVEELIGPDTISTRPEGTIRAFQDHGRVEPRLESDLDEARGRLNRLYAAGVDYDDVVATLECEGIEKFVASFDRLLDHIRAKRDLLVAAA